MKLHSDYYEVWAFEPRIYGGSYTPFAMFYYFQEAIDYCLDVTKSGDTVILRKPNLEASGFTYSIYQNSNLINSK